MDIEKAVFTFQGVFSFKLDFKPEPLVPCTSNLEPWALGLETETCYLKPIL